MSLFSRAISHTGVAFMRVLAWCPLWMVRGLGWCLGWVLHAVARPRVRVARTNWALCFPQHAPADIARAVRQHFVYFGQAWLDRSWLWHGSAKVLAQRLHFNGEVDTFAQSEKPTVLFAPHFVGLDAGWTALTALLPRTCCTLYAPQVNVVVDQWVAQGRRRFGAPLVVAKNDGLKPLASAIRQGLPLYLLPDMDHGENDSVFVPFFGVSAATLTSLPRLARVGRADVRAVWTRLTPQGYCVEIGPVWANYPSNDVTADVAQMNQHLQTLIAQAPEQYFWVHKRFKTRPKGSPSVY
jgi:Kdo2-lipid IVA lauroyltransferase/acyltransferase